MNETAFSCPIKTSRTIALQLLPCMTETHFFAWETEHLNISPEAKIEVNNGKSSAIFMNISTVFPTLNVGKELNNLC